MSYKTPLFDLPMFNELITGRIFRKIAIPWDTMGYMGYYSFYRILISF